MAVERIHVGTERWRNNVTLRDEFILITAGTPPGDVRRFTGPMSSDHDWTPVKTRHDHVLQCWTSVVMR